MTVCEKPAVRKYQSPNSLPAKILRDLVVSIDKAGQDERVKVITRVEGLKDDAETLEAAMQELITQAPWLVNPQWSPIASNQTFATLRE